MGIALFVLGFFCGALAIHFYLKDRNVQIKDLTPELNQAKLDLATIQGKLEGTAETKKKLEDDLKEANSLVLKLTSDNSTLTEKQNSVDEKLQNLAAVKDGLGKEFEILSNKIFQTKMDNFKIESKSNIESVLSPLREKLGEFQDKVTEYRNQEAIDVGSLKTELGIIFKLNQKLSTEAENLTKALKGDNKAQGNWGELILNTILESSGLREGHEYTLQGSDLKLKDDEGKRQMPDVIINLPGEKHIIVDSKVSLIGYERLIAAEDDNQRDVGMKDFLASVRKHIKDLSAKKYHANEKLISQDFVLIFIPIEGAFSTALQNDAGLFQHGWDNKIILVSPTTLMVTLKTVESIWKQENQTKNALEIARQAGALHDKFYGFIEDLSDLKKTLDKSQLNLGEAMKKLSTGQGNLVGSVVKLKELGAKANKQIMLEHDE
jgi:DNA recombination protein RmuC